jgi:aminoglycoside phosphotransferase (APT) family kinase protein
VTSDIERLKESDDDKHERIIATIAFYQDWKRCMHNVNYQTTLDLIIENLTRYVAPAVATADGQLTLTLVNLILGYFAAEATEGPAAKRQREDAIAQLPGAAGLDGSEGTDLIAALQRCPPESLIQVRHDYVDIEKNFLSRMVRAADQHASAEVTAASRPAQRQLDCERVTDYLRTALPAYPSIQATKVTEIGGGFAKKTYQLKVENGPEDWRSLIIRQDVIGGPTPLSVMDEIAVMALARDHGLPTVGLRWIERDATPLDAPFVLAEHCAGTCSLDAWLSRPASEPPPGEILATYMARLHTIPVELLPNIASAASPHAVLLDFLNGMEARWLTETPFLDPAMQFGFGWLKENIPRDIDRLAIIHADLSDRNILVHEGRITALLDWELWHVGDPCYDLAYVQPFIRKIMSWERFISIYESAGGPRVNMARSDYWYIFSEIRNAAMLASGLRSFIDGRNRDIKIIAAPLANYRRQLALGLQRLASVI